MMPVHWKDAAHQENGTGSFSKADLRGYAFFGPMCSKIINDNKSTLQINLIKGHATGLSDSEPYVSRRLRLSSLIKGYSGVGVELLEHLKNMINRYSHIPNAVVSGIGTSYTLPILRWRLVVVKCFTRSSGTPLVLPNAA